MNSKIEQTIEELEQYIDTCKPQAFSSNKIIVNKFYPVGNKYKFFMPVYKCFIRFTIFQVCLQLPYIPSV